MSNHPSGLAAKVAAVNRANQVLKDLYPVFVAAFAPFIGSKVVKTNGNLMAKVSEAMPEIIGKPGLQVWIRTGNTGAYLQVKTWEGYEGIAHYHEVGAYLCGLDISDWQTATPVIQDHVAKVRTNWTAGEVSDLQEALRAAKQAARDAETALGPFGEFDR